MSAQRRLARTARTGRDGFTIIELLLALVLLDIGLFALVGLGAAISRTATAMRASSLGVSIAWGRVERMASAGCGGTISGSAAPRRGITEWFSDTAAPNDTRALSDSVAVTLPRSARVVIARSRARC
jgi:Tfp pilus assembly protein FimT